MDFTRLLHSLSSINHIERKTILSLFLKIFQNIMENPMDDKFGNLNLTKIRSKLKKCDVSIKFLLSSGFYIDGQRLKFDKSKSNQLEKTCHLLSTVTHSNNKMSTTNKTHENIKYKLNNFQIRLKELVVECGFSVDESLKALLGSIEQFDNDVEINEAVGIDEIADKMVKKIGFALPQSLHALSYSNGDIDEAVKNILNGEDVTEVKSQVDEQKSQVNTGTETLLSMGFDRKTIHYALKAANGNVHVAQEIIFKYQKGTILCAGDVEQCGYFSCMKEMIRRHCQQDIISIDYDINIQAILDNYHHVLFLHATDDEFEYIYQKLHELNLKCNQQNCEKMRRNYRNRNQCDINEAEQKLPSPICSILDQIHCRYLHTHCFPQTEEKSQKNNRSKFMRMNTNNKQLNSFSFGYKYYYDKNVQNSNLSDHAWNVGTKLKDWYVEPAYYDLKQELLQNNIFRLNPEQFSYEIKRGGLRLNTRYCKRLKAIDPFVVASLQSGTTLIHSFYNHGIVKNTPIKLYHLVCITIYCSYDSLSYKFSETFRKLNESETTESVKKRHCEFGHFGKYIYEACNIFSFHESVKPNTFDSRSGYYHGISENMIFDGMSCNIFQPLSTTSSWEVATIFSTNSGMIIELKPYFILPYFDCCWLSDFANEKELLFMGCNYPLIFQDITNVKTVVSYTMDVKCLSIIDAMTNGWYYENDRTVRRKWVQTKMYSPVPISVKLQYRTIKLIKNELKLIDDVLIEDYIKTLLHNICTKKQVIEIRWDSMNALIAEKMDLQQNGYSGYKFLRHLFCENHIEMVNLRVMCQLFPNIERLIIRELKNITMNQLYYILDYLSNKKYRQISQINLYLNKQNRNHLQFAATKQLLSQCQNKFKNIGILIACACKGSHANNATFWGIRICYPDIYDYNFKILDSNHSGVHIQLT